MSLKKMLPRNDIQRIVASWGAPGSLTAAQSNWPTSFSRDIVPIPCHSHNDYWRKAPLYDALAAGCTGVEADVWLANGNKELYVGHSQGSLTRERTLKTLYLDPLFAILSHQNQNTSFSQNTDMSNGIFDTSPRASLTLLIDIKTEGEVTFPIINEQLQSLRDRGWLTYTNGSNRHPGPITVVSTGNTPFNLLVSNITYRDIFFDAPLNELWSGDSEPSNASLFDSQNSFYASTSFRESIGKPWHGMLSPQQTETIRGQIRMARQRGLKARYWDTPSWPISLRNRIWNLLEREGVGMLNVDDVVAASHRVWTR
ncbi:Altered inheritance of mitochondria protein 6 [Lecanora helva]